MWSGQVHGFQPRFLPPGILPWCCRSQPESSKGLPWPRRFSEQGKPSPYRDVLSGHSKGEIYTILLPPTLSLSSSPAQKELTTSQREDFLEQPSAQPVHSQASTLCGDNLSSNDSLLLGLFGTHPSGPRLVWSLLWKIHTQLAVNPWPSSFPQVLFY